MTDIRLDRQEVNNNNIKKNINKQQQHHHHSRRERQDESPSRRPKDCFCPHRLICPTIIILIYIYCVGKVITFLLQRHMRNSSSLPTTINQDYVAQMMSMEE